jgi:DNA primase
MAHQAGFKHVVATLGTALSPKHVTTLKRLTKNVILALDPDAAGDDAMLRGIQVAEAVFDRRLVPTPTSTGIQLEATIDANLRVMALPRGKDPDEVIREDPDQFRRLTAEALPVVDFWFQAVTAGLDRTRPDHRDAMRQKLLPVIRRLADRVQQAYYVQRLAQLLGVNERVLWSELYRLRPESKPVPAPDASATPVRHRPVDPLEAHCLSLLLMRPELRERLVDVVDEDFDDAFHRQILALLRTGASLDAIRDRLSPELLPAFEQLIKPALQRDPPEIARADWEKGIRRLRRNRLLRQHQAQEILRQEAIAQGQLDDANYWSERLVETAAQIARLDRELVSRRRR